jgi:hypothetical protein
LTYCAIAVLIWSSSRGNWKTTTFPLGPADGAYCSSDTRRCASRAGGDRREHRNSAYGALAKPPRGVVHGSSYDGDCAAMLSELAAYHEKAHAANIANA